MACTDCTMVFPCYMVYRYIKKSPAYGALPKLIFWRTFRFIQPVDILSKLNLIVMADVFTSHIYLQLYVIKYDKFRPIILHWAADQQVQQSCLHLVACFIKWFILSTQAVPIPVHLFYSAIRSTETLRPLEYIISQIYFIWLVSICWCLFLIHETLQR